MTKGALIVNADDLGVSKGATLGIVKAHREGIVTSASLTATTPFYQHALEVCVQACPELGIGLHFTLTAGRPASPPREVPLLIDDRGFFRWRFLPLFRAASLQKRADLLEQVEIELEAQLKKIVSDGVRPDHIDGERHIHLIPGIFERVAAAARRYGIPFLRLGRDIGPRHARLSHSTGFLLGGGILKYSLLSRLARRNRKLLKGGIASAEWFASYLYSGRLDLLWKSVLERPPATGVTEIMVHPGIPEESRDLALGNHELERYLALEDRRKELAACIEARGWLHGWRLSSFRQLAQDPAWAPS